MGLEIPPLSVKIVLESSPPKPTMSVGGLAVPAVSNNIDDEEGTVEFLLAEGLLKKTRENELRFTQRCFRRLSLPPPGRGCLHLLPHDCYYHCHSYYYYYCRLILY